MKSQLLADQYLEAGCPQERMHKDPWWSTFKSDEHDPNIIHPPHLETVLTEGQGLRVDTEIIKGRRHGEPTSFIVSDSIQP